jgi:hypothetical protein
LAEKIEWESDRSQIFGTFSEKLNEKEILPEIICHHLSIQKVMQIVSNSTFSEVYGSVMASSSNGDGWSLLVCFLSLLAKIKTVKAHRIKIVQILAFSNHPPIAQSNGNLTINGSHQKRIKT